MSDWLEETIGRAERALVRAGVRRWEICAEELFSSAAEAMDGAAEVIERSIERAVGIRVLEGGIGFAGLSEPSDEELADAIGFARREAASARPAAIDDFAGPDDARAATEERFLDPRASGTLRPTIVDSALALEAAALAADRRIARVRPARVEEDRGRFRFRTSRGLDIREDHSRAAASLVALAEDGDDTESAFASTSAPTVELLTLDAIAREASQTAAALLGAGDFETKRAPVIFGFEAVAELIALLGGALEADRLERGASFLQHALGQPTLSPALTLADDPHDAELDGACAYDGEGLATARLLLIDRGTVSAILDDRESAARASRLANARAVRSSASARPSPGAHNLALLPGSKTLAELYTLGEGGLYVHELSGTHTINEVTGELSLGASGWAVRGGARAEPVHGVTVAGTLPAMLSGAVILSSETRRFGALRVPAMLIDAVQVAA